MAHEDVSALARIEQKLDTMSEKVATLVARDQLQAEQVKEHTAQIETLKAAYNKALGILSLLSLPGVATALWVGFQITSKKP